MIEPILVSVCFIGVVGFFLGIVRARISIARLQSYIDNGTVQYDGSSFTPALLLSKSDLLKIEREVWMYVRLAHSLTPILIGKLYPKT